MSNTLVSHVFSDFRNIIDATPSAAFEGKENSNITKNSNVTNCDYTSKINNRCDDDATHFTTAESNVTITNTSASSENYDNNTSTDNADERSRDQ